MNVWSHAKPCYTRKTADTPCVLKIRDYEKEEREAASKLMSKEVRALFAEM
jgi:hypothetical protein